MTGRCIYRYISCRGEALGSSPLSRWKAAFDHNLSAISVPAMGSCLPWVRELKTFQKRKTKHADSLFPEGREHEGGEGAYSEIKEGDRGSRYGVTHRNEAFALCVLSARWLIYINVMALAFPEVPVTAKVRPTFESSLRVSH